MKEIPVRLAGFPAGAVMVNDIVATPPGATPVGENDFAINGGAITSSVAVLLGLPAAGV